MEERTRISTYKRRFACFLASVGLLFAGSMRA